MNAVRIETMIDENGEIRVACPSFHTGEEVEVIVLSRSPSKLPVNRFPYRGLPIDYQRPTDPVGEEDWDALR